MNNYNNFVDILHESFAQNTINHYIHNIERELYLNIKARILTEKELSDKIIENNIIMDKNINLLNNYNNTEENNENLDYFKSTVANVGLSANDFIKVINNFVSNPIISNKNQFGVKISNISNINVNLNENDNEIESEKNHSVNYMFFWE